MRLRRLNKTGIERFAAYLAHLKSEAATQPPRELLDDPVTSTPIPDGPEIEPREFTNRLEAARYLDALFSNVDIPDIERDVGLWTWLTLYYFDQVCPADKRERRTPGQIARYVPAVGVTRRFYRHLLLGPWIILTLHRDEPCRLDGLLSTGLHVATSETYRLFVENPTLLACDAVVGVATALYYDRSLSKMKRGAGSKDRGGCRRLIEFVQQIDCTYDLPLLTKQQLLEMLPDEFKRFIPHPQLGDDWL